MAPSSRRIPLVALEGALGDVGAGPDGVLSREGQGGGEPVAVHRGVGRGLHHVREDREALGTREARELAVVGEREQHRLAGMTSSDVPREGGALNRVLFDRRRERRKPRPQTVRGLGEALPAQEEGRALESNAVERLQGRARVGEARPDPLGPVEGFGQPEGLLERVREGAHVHRPERRRAENGQARRRLRRLVGREQDAAHPERGAGDDLQLAREPGDGVEGAIALDNRARDEVVRHGPPEASGRDGEGHREPVQSPVQRGIHALAVAEDEARAPRALGGEGRGDRGAAAGRVRRRSERRSTPPPRCP